MPKYESLSDSDDEPTELGEHGRLSGRQRPMHDVLGGGNGITLLSKFYLMHAYLSGIYLTNFVQLRMCYYGGTKEFQLHCWSKSSKKPLRTVDV
ncbi:hypothetical protein SLE2022_175760 [Rubroshorea leprosula]